MAELVLTEKEKQDPSYLDWSDDALGKLVKHLASMLRDEYGKGGVFMTLACHLLIDHTRKMNGKELKMTLEDCSFRDEKIGDWEVTVRRIR